MKTGLLTMICSLAFAIAAQAQVLYGTTSFGGIDGGGTITKFIPATNSITTVKSFKKVGTFQAYADFIQATDGKLYGMSAFGGDNDAGAIFSLDPVSSVYTKVKSFDYRDGNGANPYGGLVQAIDGMLYGTTRGWRNIWKWSHFFL